MAEAHVLSALRGKYDELLGQLHESRRNAARIHDDLDHIEGAIRLFDPGWQRSTAKARKPHRPSRWSKPKEGVRLYLAVLREADGPLTAVEIAERALRIGGYPAAGRTALKTMAGPINGALGRRADHVERLPGRPARWRLSVQRERDGRHVSRAGTDVIPW
jgi:hypothetical protein